MYAPVIREGGGVPTSGKGKVCVCVCVLAGLSSLAPDYQQRELQKVLKDIYSDFLTFDWTYKL